MQGWAPVSVELAALRAELAATKAKLQEAVRASPAELLQATHAFTLNSVIAGTLG